MLNRRHLRLKILQSLYAYHQSEVHDLQKGEKALLGNIEKMTEAYMLSLKLIDDLIHFSNHWADERDAKMMATIQNRKENRKFITNVFSAYLNENDDYLGLLKKYKIKGQTLDSSFLRKLFMSFAETDAYKDYLNAPERTDKEDLDLILVLFKKVIIKSEVVDSFFEEKTLFWESDKELVGASVIKTIKEAFKNGESFRLIELSQDWEGDKAFAISVFRKAVMDSDAFEEMIQTKTTNWDVERIALMDTIIIKAALAEMIAVPSIPIKVSMNEYLELSKSYSTPKSSNFINGLLDNLSKELVQKGIIVKTGRGLIN